VDGSARNCFVEPVTLKSRAASMKVARLFKLFMVPGENVENPGGLENKNPMDDLNTDIQAWGGRVSLIH
jgi:hypothetical protein